MSLAKRLEARRVVDRGCKIARILVTLDKAEAEALQLALDTPDEWPHSEIAEALREEGHDVSDSAVSRHRRVVCRCPR